MDASYNRQLLITSLGTRHLIGAIWLSLIFVFIPVSQAKSDQAECLDATRKLDEYRTFWQSTKTKQKLDLSLQQISDFKAQKSQFDSIYNQYMSSDFVLHEAYFASNVKLLADSIQSLISAVPGVNPVTAGAIECSAAMLGEAAEGLVTRVIHGSLNVAAMTQSMTREGVKCGAAAITDEFGAVASFTYTLYENLQTHSYLSEDHKNGVESFKQAVDRLDSLIASYQKSADYYQFMLDQHVVVESNLLRNRNDKCDEESDSSNSCSSEGGAKNLMSSLTCRAASAYEQTLEEPTSSESNLSSSDNAPSSEIEEANLYLRDSAGEQLKRLNEGDYQSVEIRRQIAIANELYEKNYDSKEFDWSALLGSVLEIAGEYGNSPSGSMPDSSAKTNMTEREARCVNFIKRKQPKKDHGATTCAVLKTSLNYYQNLLNRSPKECRSEIVPYARSQIKGLKKNMRELTCG